MPLDRRQFLSRLFRLPTAVTIFGSIVMVMAIAMPSWAADEKSWELAPYRVQLNVVVDSSARPGALTAEQFSANLMQRIRTTIYPLWSVEIVLPAGGRSYSPTRWDGKFGRRGKETRHRSV